MNPRLRTLLDEGHGVVTRREACRVASARVLEDACDGGELRRVLPSVYADAALALGPELLRAAAVRYADGRGALSHTTALDVWGVRPSEPDEPVHLSVPAGVRLRSRKLLTVHRRKDLIIAPPQVVVRQDLPVIRLEQSLVDSWPLLPPGERRAPLIRAINDRRTTPERVAALLAGAPRFADRAELRRLLDLLAVGCRSELEIWGHDRVFTGPGMPEFQRQVPIRVGGRVYYLDVYAEAERVNFELDGAASHGSPGQRERDLRRDAILATVGILTVRFSHYRLYYETAAVRQESLDILAVRRREPP
ncbi:DUF559 domain-containing protein [Actinomycetes bacterium KLBMP 9797]